MADRRYRLAVVHAASGGDMSALPITARLGIGVNVMLREVAGEIVLLDLDDEEYYGLDGVGARFFELARSGLTVGEVVQALLAEYEVERGVLEADLGVLLDDLVSTGLVTVDDPTS